MATVAQFIALFPEFKGIDAKYIQSHLVSADLSIDRQVWGLKADDGQMYLAAHRMATSATGSGARHSNADSSLQYESVYLDMVRRVSSGYRVCG